MIGMKLVIGLLIVSCLYVLQLYFNRSISLKIVVVTSMFMLSSMTYFSFDSYKGWPTKEPIVSGQLVDIQIVVPSSGSAGGIYMWVMDDPMPRSFISRLFTYQFESLPAPRAYYIPYTKESDKTMSAVKRKIKDGFIVKVGGEEGDTGVEGGNGKKTGKKNGNKGDALDYDVPNLQIISPDNILTK